MKTLQLCLGALAVLAVGCTEKNTNITQVVGPADWQGPVVAWLSPPEAEVRGTVGLDVSVHDSSRVTEVRLYLDGREEDTVWATPYRFEVVTDSLTDGVHVCEARAWDEWGNLGLSPVLRVNVANSVAQGPQVIWVPDDYPLIQAAINAATDYDTIRVRDGTYYETLNTFGKGIWMESERGPLTCNVDGQGTYNTLVASASSHPCTFRGFHLTGGHIVVRLENGARLNLINNIVADTAQSLFWSDYAGGIVQNNLFDGSTSALEPGYTWGSLYNNIIQHATRYGLWNAAIYRNPLQHGFNLFWQNAEDYAGFDPGIGDVHADPLLDLVSGILGEGSPARDAGNPLISDRDGTRSDIGPFGGPWAY
jgi:hypothetical protein